MIDAGTMDAAAIAFRSAMHQGLRAGRRPGAGQKRLKAQINANKAD